MDTAYKFEARVSLSERVDKIWYNVRRPTVVDGKSRRAKLKNLLKLLRQQKVKTETIYGTDIHGELIATVRVLK